MQQINNMRRGFTMIELIFVIVIIGILAAVAIPKLAGTAKEAKKITFDSFMGTLNRTVGPAMWAGKISSGGSVKTITQAEIIKDYIELPEGVTLDMSGCTAPGVAPGVVGAVSTVGLPKAEIIYCIDGTSVSAPKFGYGVDGNDTNVSLQNN